jgi:hypothetical protein
LVVAHNAAGGRTNVSLSAEVEANPPVIERFDSDRRVLERPGSVQLCFRVRNAERLTIDQAGPQPQSSSDGCVSRFVGATTTFTLAATGEEGSSAQRSWTVTVAAAPPPPPQPPPPVPQAPVILDFRADPALLRRPGATNLCFTARNAESAVIQPGGPQPSSPNGACVSRSLSETTIYTLTVARRGAPPQQRTATVTVETPPPSPESPVILEFRANPSRLKERGRTNLCFTARNAERAMIQPGEDQPTSPNGGCVWRSLGETTTFTLTVSRRGAPPQQQTARVTVEPPTPSPEPPVITDFRANPPRVKQGGQTNLCFTARNAESATIQPGGPQPSSPNGGCVARSLSQTTTYTLTVSRRGAPAQQRATTVIADVPPITKETPGTGPLGGATKGGVVEKFKPGVRDAIMLLGYCCQSGSVTRKTESQCRAEKGKWFGSPPSTRDCPLIR